MDIYVGNKSLASADANVYKLFIEGVIESIDNRYMEASYEERLLLEAQRHKLMEASEDL